MSPTQMRRSTGRRVCALHIRLKTKHRATGWFDVVGWRPTTPDRPGGLVVAQGDDVVGVAVVALPAAERPGLADLLGRYGRRDPTMPVRDVNVLGELRRSCCRRGLAVLPRLECCGNHAYDDAQHHEERDGQEYPGGRRCRCPG
jgi:hypothetical protein